ncbi:RNA polymerase subunit sigma [Bosea caraganae]|uniref:RNA polymerase subunit sigma n=1 Tax=Bosea caraganae TaxID=2763117 RepID=A0A370L6Q8_9HYPH|nr:ECF-type sigma factor [Bosea caraganae]RDJ25430.1 RNA polymerase subunit sigma [Bosea caraganae]RDJ25785.1 RNA polymerase subunit sigma [Bosea caraganae]
MAQDHVDPDQPHGDGAAPAPPLQLDHLTRSLYDVLHTIAHRERLRAGRPATLQTTALISESYLKLRQSRGWNSEEHFLASAATAMRHVLVDAARARLSRKRGDGIRAVPLDEEHDELPEVDDGDVVRISDALAALEQVDERLVKVVECRFFAGYSEEETARILGISARTVRRDWLQAKAWLFRELQGG